MHCLSQFLSRFFFALGLLLPTLSPGAAADPAKRPPNVLLICVDDLRPELSLYGVNRAKTPNLDRLARESMVFDRAYCQQAVCSPSRISMLTGLRPDSTGIHDLNTRIADRLPGWRTMPQAFREAGYKTISIGKVYHHHAKRNFDDPKGWSQPPIRAQGEWEGRGYLLPSSLETARKAYRLEATQESLAHPLPKTWTVRTSDGFQPSQEQLAAALQADTESTALPRSTSATLEKDGIDLRAVFPKSPQEVGLTAILSSRISLDAPAKMTIGAGADWWMEWYLNGKPVFGTPEGNNVLPIAVTNHLFEVQLPAGESRIDVVVRSGSKGWRLEASSGPALQATIEKHNAGFRVNRGPAWEMADVPDDAYPDGANTERAIAELKRLKEEQPFFLALGLYKPHLPFNAPKRYWDLYDRDRLAVPARDAPRDISRFALTNSGELRAYPGMPKGKQPFSDEETRTLIHGYLACVSYTDALIGQVLDALKKLDLEDDTIVVIWGDHGWKLGDYGQWCKHTNMEFDTRVPLILKVPGKTTSPRRTEALVESIDIFPTLCELTGVAPTPGIEGRSLVPLLNDPNMAWDEVAYMQYPRERAMGYAVRSRNHRFVQWRDQKNGTVLAEELFDHRNDPGETRNVAADPSQAEALRQHRQYVEQWPKPSPAATDG